MVITSCSNGLEQHTTNDKNNNQSINKYNSELTEDTHNNQKEINSFLEVLDFEKENQIGNFQLLGSWFGRIEEDWINMVIVSTSNNMVTGYVVINASYCSFKGWWSSDDNINYKLGLSSQYDDIVNYYDLTISLENMNVQGTSSIVSNKVDSNPLKLSLTKRNINYDVTAGQFPDMAQRQVDLSELKELSDIDLMYICQEILARHGQIFIGEDIRSIFSLKPWYSPINFKVDHLLTDVEKNNLEKIYVLL